MTRYFLPALAVIAAIFATVTLLKHRAERIISEPPSSPPMTSFTRTVAGLGITEPNSESIAMGTPLPGVVQKVFVSEGQMVKLGDPLFQLETRHLEASLAIRRAALIAAHARMKSAQTILDDANEQLSRAKRLTAGVAISADDLMRRTFATKEGEARLGEAHAETVTAQAHVEAAETDIERSTVRAPIDATVLKLNVRPGQFAGTDQASESLLIIGRVRPLHLRVDVDEHEAWRIQREAPAIAHLRGQAGVEIPLKFVRFSPMITPKRSLTGSGTERVDTRVLQVIYEIIDEPLPLFVGQQMDVFIEDRTETNAPRTKSAEEAAVSFRTTTTQADPTAPSR